MGRLLVQKLHPDAKLPTVAHPGEDAGYDIFALEDVFLQPNQQVLVRTGIAARYVGDPPSFDLYTARLGDKHSPPPETPRYWLEVRDRSSMALKNGLHTMAGVVDAGWTGEIGVVMILLGPPKHLSAAMWERRMTSPFYQTMEPVARLNKLTDNLADHIRHYLLGYGSYPAAEELGYQIMAGDKVAQLIPHKILTSTIEEVEELPGGARGTNGYGSSGK